MAAVNPPASGDLLSWLAARVIHFVPPKDYFPAWRCCCARGEEEVVKAAATILKDSDFDTR